MLTKRGSEKAPPTRESMLLFDGKDGSTGGAKPRARLPPAVNRYTEYVRAGVFSFFAVVQGT